LVLDASPLIYLAKLSALDVFSAAGYRAKVPESVARETTGAGVAYRHPDAAEVTKAIGSGLIEVVQPTEPEVEDARRIQAMAAGLHQGEADVLAIGRARGIPITVTERQAGRFARSLGLQVVGFRQLLFEGTRDLDQLETRLRSLANLTQMRMSDLDQLIAEIDRRRT
jgi:predicted nucleic acid-binding protein